ncbi:MAG TPA: peptidoglycan-associated lipoprotein Pal [Candidatus Methylomirabilis sp.]|nr:peptidoglycan-associated lipoprotein Pal [Candidatus Methylomirabilis sp.]
MVRGRAREQQWTGGKLWGAILIVGAALLLTGCPKKPEVAGGAAGGPGAEKVTPAKPITEAPVQPGARPTDEGPLKDVFFDFDKAVIRDDGKQALNEDIQWLKANPTARIMIEGHCDERGTNEYNLALGERRARAARDYLVAGGIDAKRISTISYGEERPFVLGHDEAAWKWNRRDHFVVQK